MTSSPTYSVKTEVFEGPLDLLLSLIEKRKLLINDIALAKVTDDFLAYVRNLEAFPIPDTADFILVAATLILIKSRSLLPVLSLSNEEQEHISDLEERLKTYQRIKELAENVRAVFGKQIIFRKTDKKILTIVFSPPPGLSLEAVKAAMADVIARMPKPEARKEARVRKTVSLDEVIEDLTKRMTSSLKMSFKQFAKTRDKADKVHVIISFLALLELVKRGTIDANQEENFSDITMETRDIGVPRYI